MKLETQAIVARNLRTLRTSRCVSQEQLARDVGICRHTYAACELGNRTPDPEAMYKIARRFGVKMDILFIEDHYAFLSAIATSYYYSDQEAELIAKYNELTDFSKGMLIEKASQLVDWDKQRASQRAALERRMNGTA